MVPWVEPFPTEIKTVKNRWLDTFAAGVPEKDLGERVLAEGNFLWHLFSWELVPHLTGDAAQKALAEHAGEELYLFYYEYPPEGAPLVRRVSGPADLPPEQDSLIGADWYVVDKDFTWTYAHTHEDSCGPYFCMAPQA